VENPDILMNEQQVLYIGEEGGTRSSYIYANYDFSDIFSEEYPETLFTAENIKNVKFSLTKLKYYAADTTDTGLYYQIQQLDEPFDPRKFENYPVTDPPTAAGPFLNSDFDQPNDSIEPLLPFFDATDLLSWIAAGDSVGIILSLGPGSDPGLFGFASRDLTAFNELEDLAVGTIVAPNFVVEFNDEAIPNFLLGPYADTSTFDQVPAPPAAVADGFLLRTCLRSYPALLFDLANLPPNAFINRALLSITNDPTTAFGNLGSITVLEWDEVRFSAPYDSTTVDQLNDPNQRYSFRVTGQNSLDPHLNETIQFDVTQAILRVINQVYAPQTRGFLLTAGENFFPEGAFTPVSPDFYYREFRFLGTNAVDPLHRPQLKITYSVVNDLQGGGK
jgi:hypothetical protein